MLLQKIKFSGVNYSNQATTVLLLISLFVYSMFAVIIGMPIFGSDEYAYFISGKYIDNLAELYKLDPTLQHAPNFLHLQIINAWGRFTGSAFTQSFRILHAAQYILTAVIINQMFKKVIDRDSAFWGTVAFLLFPSVIYIYAVMPEIELVLLSACLGYVLIVVFPRHQYLAGGLSGFLLGIAILIKPHAVASLAAASVIVSVAPIVGFVKGGRAIAMRTLLIMLGTCYLSVILLLRLCNHEWCFNPTLALGFNTYGQHIKTSLSGVSIISRVISSLYYAAAHVAVIAIIFSPVLVWSVARLLKTIRLRKERQEATANGHSLVGLFILSMLVMHIAMTAWFTAGAAELSAGEAMRLHGRYLGPVLAFLPFIYFYAIRHLSEWDENAVKFITFIALITCLLYFFQNFKIFPWDYPLLFAFFKAPNHYGWNYEGSFSSLGFILLWAMIAAWIAIIFFKSILSRVLFFQIFVILLVGCIQTYSWVFSHTKANSYMTESARAINTIVGQNQFGKGLLVSDERYGRTSYILYSLANAPKVLIKRPGSVVDAADAAGVDWILFDKDYVAEFRYLESISFGTFRFFPLNSLVSVSHREKSTIKSGEKISLLLGARQYAPGNLKGFNEQEEWGVWSAASHAEIVLPVLLHGAIKIKLYGWTIPENMGTPLLVKICNASTKIMLTDANKDYDVIINVSQPTDRIYLESSIHPVNSHRNLGVAVNIIMLERLKQ